MPSQDPSGIDTHPALKRSVKAAAEINEADEPDQFALAGLRSLQLENELTHARIENVKSDRKLRESYASRILRFLYYYAAVVGMLVIASGLQVSWMPFELPWEVLALLVGSAAASAIGLVGFIARGLFKTPPSLDLRSAGR